MYSFIAKHLLYYPIQFFRGEKVGQYIDEVRAFNRLDCADEYSWTIVAIKNIKCFGGWSNE